MRPVCFQCITAEKRCEYVGSLLFDRIKFIDDSNLRVVFVHLAVAIHLLWKIVRMESFAIILNSYVCPPYLKLSVSVSKRTMCLCRQVNIHSFYCCRVQVVHLIFLHGSTLSLSEKHTFWKVQFFPNSFSYFPRPQQPVNFHRFDDEYSKRQSGSKKNQMNNINGIHSYIIIRIYEIIYR